MAADTAVTMANAIKETFEPGYRELFRNDVVLSTLRAFGMREVQAPGGEYHQWHLNSSGNTSVALFTENDPAPASVAQGWARAYVGWNYYWGWVTLTGIGCDAVQGGNFDAVSAALQLCARDLIDLRSTTLLGSSSNGLEVAIDYGTAYAGITRNGSAGYFESTESSTNSLAGIRASHRATRDASKGGRPNLHLVSPTILEWYANLGGTYVAATGGNGNLRLTQMADGSPLRADFGLATSGFSFYGAPVVELPDVTSTVWLGLDLSAGNFVHKIIRNLQIEPHSRNGDNQLFEVSCGSALAVEMPRWSFKETGLS